jgi:hypothetical protein
LTSILAVLHNATMPHEKKSPFETGKSTASLGFSSRSLTIIVAFGIILFVAIGVAIYFYMQYRQSADLLTKSAQSGDQQVLISEVGKLIVLPTEEQPTVATVSNVNKLRTQSFFEHARNGDKVLIYTKAQEAILYDPYANKIVEVGPVNLTQPTPTPSGPTVTPAPVRVAVYNGTATSGLANKIGSELSQEMPYVTITAKGDAQQTYSTTIVVDLTGKNESAASLVAKELGGQVSKLPKGEIRPTNADLLVILGK